MIKACRGGPLRPPYGEPAEGVPYVSLLVKDLGYVPEETYSVLKEKYEIVIRMLSILAKSSAKKAK
jgi:hypothetical protein